MSRARTGSSASPFAFALPFAFAFAFAFSSAARADVTTPSVQRAAGDSDIRCHANRCVVSRALVVGLFARSGVRVVPRLADGRPDGIMLYAIRRGSYAARLLLKNGDVVLHVNRLDLSTPDRALQAYAAFRDGRHVEVELERRGQPLTMEYDIQ